MPRKKKKAEKANTRSRSSSRKTEVVVEERTRVTPSRRVVIVRPEPITLSRALGEAAVVEPAAESRVTTQTVTRRRKRV